MTKHLDIDTKAMRAKILDLAIRGKLTDQRQEDGNARDLLKEIQAEKERLIKEKKIKKEKPLPEITEEEKPFEIPDSWEWVRLGDLGAPIQYPFADGPFGSNLKKEHYTTNREVRIIQLSNIGENGWRDENVKYTTFEHLKLISRSEVDPGDIVIAKMMPAGRAIIVPDKDPKYVLSSDAVKFVPNKHLYLPFVINCINSPVFQNQVTANVQGTTRKSTSLSKLKNCLLPIPPLAEQQRIADKVSALFAQLDVIDKAYEEYQGLQQAMKAKLLELAIQGKLTDQRKEDGDARDLFQDIQEEKKRLIAEKKIKKEKPLPEIEADEIPFEIPTNWTWVRLGEIVSVFGGKRIPKGTKLQDTPTKYRYIRVADMEYNTVNIPSVKYISEEIYKKIKRYTISDQDVYITVAGTIGKVGTIPHELNNANLTENANKLVPYNLNKEFLCNILKSPFGKAQIEKNITRVSQPKLAIKRIERFVIPLPPLAEQKRIVAKLDELLPHLNPGKEP